MENLDTHGWEFFKMFEKDYHIKSDGLLDKYVYLLVTRINVVREN